MLYRFKYINKSLWIIYVIVSICELFTWVQLVDYIILFIFQSLTTAKLNGVWHSKFNDVKQIWVSFQNKYSNNVETVKFIKHIRKLIKLWCISSSTIQFLDYVLWSVFKKTKTKHNVLETGSAFICRWKGWRKHLLSWPQSTEVVCQFQLCLFKKWMMNDECWK